MENLNNEQIDVESILNENELRALQAAAPRRRRIGCLTILAVILIISFFSFLLGGDSSDTPKESNEISAFEIPSSISNKIIVLDSDYPLELYVKVPGADEVTRQDISFVNSDDSVAKIKFSDYNSLFERLYILVTPVSSGTTTFYIQTANGKVKSEAITVKVNIDNKVQTPSQSTPETPPGPAKIEQIELPLLEDDYYDLMIGETADSYFDISGSGAISGSDFKFVSSDESIATITFDRYGSILDNLYFTITAKSVGTATLHVESKDGTVKSPAITVNVTKSKEVSYEIVDTYYNISTDFIGSSWIECFAIVENTGGLNLYLSPGSFDIEDTNGKLIDTAQMVSAFPQVIAPGERAVYHAVMIFDNGDINSKYVIVPKVNVTKSIVPLIRYKTYDVSLFEDSYGNINFIGRVTNHTDETESLCYVAIMLYNEQNKLIATEFTIISDDIAPGETASFSQILLFDNFGVDLSDVARYEIFAYSYQFQID